MELDSTIFTRDNREILRRYGYWLEALATGKIAPLTEDQEKFLKVAKGEVEPKTDYEIAWDKLAQRRKFENDKTPHFIHHLTSYKDA